MIIIGHFIIQKALFAKTIEAMSLKLPSFNTTLNYLCQLNAARRILHLICHVPILEHIQYSTMHFGKQYWLVLKICTRAFMGWITAANISDYLSSQKDAILHSISQSRYRAAGVDIQSQEAYELASQGLLRPVAKGDASTAGPVLYGIRCVQYKPPDFMLGGFSCELYEYLVCVTNHIVCWAWVTYISTFSKVNGLYWASMTLQKWSTKFITRYISSENKLCQLVSRYVTL